MVMRRLRVNRHTFAKARAHSRTCSLSEPLFSLAIFFVFFFSLGTFQPWIIKSVQYNALTPPIPLQVQPLQSDLIFGLDTLVLGPVWGSITVHSCSYL